MEYNFSDQFRREELDLYSTGSLLDYDDESSSIDVMKLVQENQGAEGINPDTGKVKYNPYLIPPDLEICREYQVSQINQKRH